MNNFLIDLKVPLNFYFNNNKKERLTLYLNEISENLFAMFGEFKKQGERKKEIPPFLMEENEILKFILFYLDIFLKIDVNDSEKYVVERKVHRNGIDNMILLKK